ASAAYGGPVRSPVSQSGVASSSVQPRTRRVSPPRQSLQYMSLSSSVSLRRSRRQARMRRLRFRQTFHHVENGRDQENADSARRQHAADYGGAHNLAPQ